VLAEQLGSMHDDTVAALEQAMDDFTADEPCGARDEHVPAPCRRAERTPCPKLIAACRLGGNESPERIEERVRDHSLFMPSSQ
jgi:hypothetical protein